MAGVKKWSAKEGTIHKQKTESNPAVSSILQGLSYKSVHTLYIAVIDLIDGVLQDHPKYFWFQFHYSFFVSPLSVLGRRILAILGRAADSHAASINSSKVIPYAFSIYSAFSAVAFHLDFVPNFTYKHSVEQLIVNPPVIWCRYNMTSSFISSRCLIFLSAHLMHIQPMHIYALRHIQEMRISIPD